MSIGPNATIPAGGCAHGVVARGSGPTSMGPKGVEDPLRGHPAEVGVEAPLDVGVVMPVGEKSAPTFATGFTGAGGVLRCFVA